MTGQPTCASDNLTEAPPAWLSQAAGSAWFQRLRAGEDTILARAPDAPGVAPSLIVAIRLERPMGAFNGVMLATVPLSRLQPDINDPALPEGSQAALTDAAGRLLTVTERDAFLLRNGS